MVAALIGAPTIASADEGGVSFWLPGLFGSLAATPLQPGWTLSTVYYHTSVSADADVARAREFTIGKLPVPVGVTANLSGNLNAPPDLALVNPTYVFEPKVLGGQLAVGVMGLYGRASTDLAATLSGSVLIRRFSQSHSHAPTLSAIPSRGSVIFIRKPRCAGTRACTT